jgi:hypothetical protein
VQPDRSPAGAHQTSPAGHPFEARMIPIVTLVLLVLVFAVEVWALAAA